MAYLIKGLETLDDDLIHALKDRNATFTELDLCNCLISETGHYDEWDHLYRPTEGYMNEKDKIVTGEYMDILIGLVRNYRDYIGHIIPDRLLIIEDVAWELKETSTDNSNWKIQIQKAPKLVREITGWDYIIKTRKHWNEHLDKAQKAAMIFAELVRIDKEDGSILKLTSRSYSVITSTFGSRWLDKDVKLPDISEERIGFVGFKRANGQLTFAEIEGETKEVEISE